MSDGIYERIAVIFYNNPTRSFTRKEIARLVLKNVPDANTRTIDTALHKHHKRTFIRRYRHPGYRGYSYILDDERAVKMYLAKVDLPDLSYTASYTQPWEAIRTFDHHKRIPITLTDDQFARLESRFSEPSPRDRAKNRTFECGSFKITVSQLSLKGVLFILSPRYLADLRKYFGPEFTEYVHELPVFKGISIDAEMWKDFRLAQKDLTVLFGSSHTWKELDAEGQQTYVNTFLQLLTGTAFQETTFQAVIVEYLKINVQEMSEVKGMMEHLFKEWKALMELTTKIAEKKQEQEELPPAKEFTDHDEVMYQ